MCSIQVVPESEVWPQFDTGQRVCTPNSPISSWEERIDFKGGFHNRGKRYLREVMKAVVAIQCCLVLADRPTFKTSQLAPSLPSVGNISVCHFCFHRALLHKLSEFVVVLANVEGKGVSIGQNLSANFALVLRVAIAGENLFLVMHRDEVEVEQVLVLGLLFTEVTREQFWRLWGRWRRGGCGQSFCV